MKRLTRIWMLLTIICGIFWSAMFFKMFGSGLMSQLRAKACMHSIYQIHQACFAYAETHDHQFPDGATSNEAFRKLFAAELLDDEKLFYLKPLFSAQAAGPDGKIGDKASEYREALAPGECCYYMVKSKGTESDPASRLLLFVKLGQSDGKVYFISASVGGNAGWNKIEPSSPEVLTNEYIAKKFGVDAGDILSPEGPLPGPWEIPVPATFMEKYNLPILLGMIAVWIVLLVVRRRREVGKVLTEAEKRTVKL